MTDEKNLPVPGQGTDLTRLSESARQIARMNEGELRDDRFLDEHHLIHPRMKDKSVLEEFRHIRTRLLQHSRGDNAVTLVSGVGHGAGSALVALNLGVAFALDSAKTALVVDCCVSDPHLDRQLDLAVTYGLTDFLVDDEMDEESIIYPSGISRLRIIAAGSHFESTSEFFTSLKMRAFIERLQARYPDRFIILSAPPMDGSADSRILADLCDQAVLVAGYGRVSDNRLMDAANALGQEKLAGVILNRVPHLSSPFA